jgi:hypothetical protein
MHVAVVDPLDLAAIKGHVRGQRRRYGRRRSPAAEYQQRKYSCSYSPGSPFSTGACFFLLQFSSKQSHPITRPAPANPLPANAASSANESREPADFRRTRDLAEHPVLVLPYLAFALRWLYGWLGLVGSTHARAVDRGRGYRLAGAWARPSYCIWPTRRTAGRSSGLASRSRWRRPAASWRAPAPNATLANGISS